MSNSFLLSQLSIINYTLSIEIRQDFVVPGRLELPTSTLSVWRSNQLSYRTVSASKAWKLASYLSSLNSLAYKKLRVQNKPASYFSIF